MSDTTTMPRASGPIINTIYRDRPWAWLAQGWRDLMVQYIYNTGFTNQVQNFGLASAASVLLGVVLFILTLTQLFVTRRRDRG